MMVPVKSNPLFSQTQYQYITELKLPYLENAACAAKNKWCLGFPGTVLNNFRAQSWALCMIVQSNPLLSLTRQTPRHYSIPRVFSIQPVQYEGVKSNGWGRHSWAGDKKMT